MKYAFLIFLPFSLFAKDLPPSMLELKKTVEHIQKISKDQQRDLDQTRVANQQVRAELATSKKALSDSAMALYALQKEIQRVTDDRNEQAQLKDAALDRVDKEKKRADEAIAKYHKLKLYICGIAAALAAFAAWRFLGLIQILVPPPYSFLAPVLAAGATFTALWFLL